MEVTVEDCHQDMAILILVIPAEPVVTVTDLVPRNQPNLPHPPHHLRPVQPHLTDLRTERSLQVHTDSQIVQALKLIHRHRNFINHNHLLMENIKCLSICTARSV